MPAIKSIRPVLLSAPYGDPYTNAENRYHLPSGLRTTGLVELILDDGTSGIGEGYLAVFAPQVFCEIVKLVSPYLVGRDVQDTDPICRDLELISGYWSRQGAARHVISAIEIAINDCRGKLAGLPVYALWGGKQSSSLQLYASGGDSIHARAMQREIDHVAELGIKLFKIRARMDEIDKLNWCVTENGKQGIGTAVDMTQNLSVPGYSAEMIMEFLQQLPETILSKIRFLEESLGEAYIHEYPLLRSISPVAIAGGEIVTTASELNDRVRQHYYDIVQPDATVIGGIKSTLDVFSAAAGSGCEVVVHNWGSAVGMLANYHAAIAGGGKMAEWPLPAYGLREELIRDGLSINNGNLIVQEQPGLGIQLTPAIESKYPFREEAVYRCKPAAPRIAWDSQA